MHGASLDGNGFSARVLIPNSVAVKGRFCTLYAQVFNNPLWITYQMLTSLRLIVLFVVLALTGGPAVLVAAPLSHQTAIHPTDTPDTRASVLLQWLGSALVLFGAIRIKPLDQLAAKFARNATAAAGDYKSGVEQAGGDWETNTAASEDNYQAGVGAAIARKSFGKGVRAAGASKYVERASKMGSARYGPGVQNAQGDWAKGFAPVAQVISSVNLPPKGPKRSPQNQQRANAMATALGAWKEAQ